jgi:phosphoribosylanthranilate isomerase
MKLPQLKFCGFTRQEDVAQALELQIDAIGLNFYPKGKRYIEPQSARKLSLIAQGACLRVGIFVDSTPEQIDRVLSFCPLDAIQLHGSETVDWLGQYQQSSYWPSLPIAERSTIRSGKLGSQNIALQAHRCSVCSLMLTIHKRRVEQANEPIGGCSAHAPNACLDPRPRVWLYC